MKLVNIDSLQLNVYKYKPVRAGSYMVVPACLRGKHCLINPQNYNDDFCLVWCILIHQYWKETDTHRERISKYRRHFKTINIANIKFPIEYDDIEKLEKQNKLVLNVYTVIQSAEGWSDVAPLRISKVNSLNAINVLLLQAHDKQHFCLISNFSRLLMKKYSCINKVY